MGRYPAACLTSILQFDLLTVDFSYVATVKFDCRAKIPYGGALRSLSQILQQILSEPEDEINAFYDHLKSSLGTQFCNIPLLADVVPELRPLLDPSIEVTETIDVIHMDNVETRIRFHNLFVEVFRVITFWRMTTLVSNIYIYLLLSFTDDILYSFLTIFIKQVT